MDATQKIAGAKTAALSRSRWKHWQIKDLRAMRLRTSSEYAMQRVLSKKSNAAASLAQWLTQRSGRFCAEGGR